VSQTNLTFAAPIAPGALARPRVRKPFLRREKLGLFALGFGSTTLLIHFAVGYFAAARMTSAFPHLYL
jgi:hypothetical protein